jgi:peptidoglycan-associated lipoprotein
MKNVSRFLVVGATVLFVGGCASNKPAMAPSPVDLAPAAATPTPAPVSIPASAVVEPVAPESALSLEAVYFEFDSYSLTMGAQESLRKMAAALKRGASIKIQVEGHCDERGSNEYNLALGERRSRGVKDFLMGEGVAASAVSTISYGEEKPAVLGTGEEVWAKNRRAEFKQP